MRRIRLSALAVVLLAATGGVYAADGPDAIYFGGPIITMNDKALFAEAVAIKEGKIIAVDRLRTIEALADEQTKRIDFQGKTMLPGFIDAHSHFLATGAQALTKVDLNPPPMGDVQNIDELVSKLKARVEQTGEKELVSGSGYDDTFITEKRHPTKADLDRVSTQVPIIITHISGHISVGNSKALELAGITAETPNPDGGRIDKDKKGEPTGIMEGNAGALITQLISDQSEADWVAAIEKGSELWAAAGFTTASGLQQVLLRLQITWLILNKSSISKPLWPRINKKYVLTFGQERAA